MLVELTINKESENQFIEGYNKLKGEGYYENIPFEYVYPNNENWRPHEGIYEGPLSNANFYYWLYEEFDTGRQPRFETYGVADSIEQILNYHKEEFIDSPEKYILFFTKIYQDKENAGKGGGWRWHKWGEYIGNLNPQCEYLDDEEFGEDFPGYVLVYEFFKVPE